MSVRWLSDRPPGRIEPPTLEAPRTMARAEVVVVVDHGRRLVLDQAGDVLLTP